MCYSHKAAVSKLHNPTNFVCIHIRYADGLGALQDAYEDFAAAKQSARGDMDALPLPRGAAPAAALSAAASPAAGATAPPQPALADQRRQQGAGSSGDGLVGGGYAAGLDGWGAGYGGYAGALNGAGGNGSAVTQYGAGVDGYSAGLNGHSSGTGNLQNGSSRGAPHGNGAAAGGGGAAQPSAWPAFLLLPPLLPLPAPALGLVSAMLPGGAQALDSSARMWAASPWGLALSPSPGPNPAGASGAPPSAREALRFILSPDGAFFREFLTNEIVVSVDALSRAGAPYA